VISGTAEAVAETSARAKKGGAKRVIPLEVGGAFHSRLMEPAAVRLQQALKEVEIRAARFPVASNVTGSYHTRPAEVRVRLVEQMTRPVQWVGCVRAMLQAGIRIFLEVGPGTVLKGLVRKIEPQAAVHSAGTAEEIFQAAPLFCAQSA